ncbi:MAG: LCP family protein, partial [Armatimonadota bacterium]|nr:LCP family protein [Armatimonadota bacterium]
MPAPPPGRERRYPLIRRLAALALLAGALFALAAGAWAYRLLARLDHNPEKGRMADILKPPFEGKRRVFLLVLGVDEKNRLFKSDRRRSDTMILACLDFEAKRVAALSLPRDTRVQLPGHQDFDKLNAAHAYGGVPLAQRAVADLVGIPPDRYVKTDVNGFRAIVDLIGPIEIEVEKPMHYDDNWGNLHIHLQPGLQRLNGEQALGYVRFRKDSAGDLGRMQRQQKFLRAVVKQMLTPAALVRLPKILEEGT